jgi:hypothetical protein
MSTPVHVTIPEPCHENWQQMTPNEQGRHCMSCQKTVIDFSLMSDQEILQYISTAGSHVCGRFNNDQLNKTYKERTIKRSFSWRYAWNMVVATFLMTGNVAMAQSKGDGKKDSAIVNNVKKPDYDNVLVVGKIAARPVKATITGTVVDDSTGKPIVFASVRLESEEAGIAANKEGKFKLKTEGYYKTTLVVSAVGYTTKEYEVTLDHATGLEIHLTPEAYSLNPVVVRGYYSSKMVNCGVMGGVTSVYAISISEKITREINEWLPKKEVRINPNPVAPGNSATVSLNLKETGAYRMELLDASGRLVWAEGIQVNQPTQTVAIPTQSSWSRGVYWLRISSGKVKKVYQAKMLVQ